VKKKVVITVEGSKRTETTVEIVKELQSIAGIYLLTLWTDTEKMIAI